MNIGKKIPIFCLSFYLNIGITLPIFILWGNMTVRKIVLIMWARTGDILSFTSLMACEEMLSTTLAVVRNHDMTEDTSILSVG